MRKKGLRYDHEKISQSANDFILSRLSVSNLGIDSAYSSLLTTQTRLAVKVSVAKPEKTGKFKTDSSTPRSLITRRTNTDCC